MRKRIWIVSIVLLTALLTGCFGGGGGTGSVTGLKGEILDAETGKKITGEVYITLGGKEVVESGSYSISGIAAGPATLTAKAPGYEQYREAVTIAKNKLQEHNIKLQRQEEKQGAEGLVDNVKEAGLLFTGIWDANLNADAQEELAKTVQEMQGTALYTFGVLGKQPDELEITGSDGSLSIKHSENDTNAEFTFTGLDEIISGLDPRTQMAALKLEDILVASFSVVEGTKEIAAGELGIRADVDHSLLEEWLEWLESQTRLDTEEEPEEKPMPEEMFFTILQINMNAWFETSEGKLEFSGDVRTEYSDEKFAFNGVLDTPFLNFKGEIEVGLQEYQGEVLPENARFDGELKLLERTKLKGTSELKFVVNEHMEEVLLKKATFNGSHEDLKLAARRSVGVFSFEWENAAEAKGEEEMKMTVEFRGEVNEPGQYPFKVDLEGTLENLEANINIEYKFGNTTLTGEAQISFTDVSGETEVSDVSINLKDTHGNEINIGTEGFDSVGEPYQVAWFINSQGEEEAGIWIDESGLPYVKYASGKTEYLFEELPFY